MKAWKLYWHVISNIFNFNEDHKAVIDHHVFVEKSGKSHRREAYHCTCGVGFN